MYQRAHRARKTIQMVPDLPAVDQMATVEAGSVVEAVQAQVDAFEVTNRPALVAIARVCAQGLDNSQARPQHAALARQLVVTLGELARSGTRRGRLAAVQQMTRGVSD
jgi:hypothetical protein